MPGNKDHMAQENIEVIIDKLREQTDIIIFSSHYHGNK